MSFPIVSFVVFCITAVGYAVSTHAKLAELCRIVCFAAALSLMLSLSAYKLPL